MVASAGRVVTLTGLTDETALGEVRQGLIHAAIDPEERLDAESGKGVHRAWSHATGDEMGDAVPREQVGRRALPVLMCLACGDLAFAHGSALHRAYHEVLTPTEVLGHSVGFYSNRDSHLLCLL
jgi:hypothetical protein